MIRMAWITSGYIPSPGRMAVIAGTTFTQLVRMKVFLFLGLFAVALLALSSFRLSAVLGPETGGINELVLLKNSAYGAMRVFGLFFCVAATALIIPRDAEDRILYTILCKPVPRIDYLMGEGAGCAGSDPGCRAADGCRNDAGAVDADGYGGCGADSLP